MITPGAGFQVDPNNPNGVIPIGSQSSVNNPNAGYQNAGQGGTPAVAPAPVTGGAQTGAATTNAGKPGYDIFGNAVRGTPLATGGSSSTATTQAPPTPTVTINNNTPQTQPQIQPTTSSTPPTSSLQPGAQGDDVKKLQDYLVQQGYLTPDQIGTGAGTYGPQTTAAVAKMQGDLGVQAGTGAGFYGPQTQSALAQKYQGLHASMSGSSPDSSATARQSIQDSLSEQQTQNNPVMSALSSSMQPIMQSLAQVLQNVNNPALTAVSLQQEYNDMREKAGLPEMQTKLLNMQNIMNGTEEDIRDEVTKTGGFATESQVQGLAAARNKVILKQYNSLATAYDAAQNNVQSMMQYAQTDQSTSLQRAQITAGITESLASINAQMVNMGMTMQNNARQGVQFAVSQMGYSGLAAGAQGNKQVLGYYENMLGLAPGALSDSTALKGMDTYKDQQLQLNNYKSQIQAYNAGYTPSTVPAPAGTNSQYGTATSTVSRITGYDPNTPLSQIDVNKLVPAMTQNEGSSPKGVVNNPGNIKFIGLPGQIDSGVKATDGGTFANYKTPELGQAAIASNIQSAMAKNPNMTLGAFVDRYTNTAPKQPGQIGINPVDASTLIRPPSVDNKIPLTLSAAAMDQYTKTNTAAHVDPGTNNIVAPGIGYYMQQSNGSYVLKAALPSGLDSQYSNIKQTIANTAPESLSPTVTRKWSLTANAATSAFKDTGTYKVISNIAPYLANIRAASENPGSVGDLELLDSYVRASKGGAGQVTGDQVDIVLRGSSIGDKASVMEQKLQKGGVLSPQQRTDLIKLSSSVYQENSSDYKKIYVQAIQNMQKQGVPVQFWGNLPDLTSLMTQ